MCGEVAKEDHGEKVEEEKPRGRTNMEADLGIVFSMFDHDDDGFITVVELEESLKWLDITVSAAEAMAMVSRVDANSDGLIDIHEFRELYYSIPKKRKHQFLTAAGAEVDARSEEANDEEEEMDLWEAFDVFDNNKDGLISAKELDTVIGSLGLCRPDRRPVTVECRDMIRLSDGDGMVRFEDFKRMMTVVNVKA